MPATYMNEVCI